ncbi:hypothetical protein CLM62_47030 [Streptomyces sp. SA15]|nr:hypothetical protein CLM62_47030 [Streptomyces sp. SA15]
MRGLPAVFAIVPPASVVRCEAAMRCTCKWIALVPDLAITPPQAREGSAVAVVRAKKDFKQDISSLKFGPRDGTR